MEKCPKCAKLPKNGKSENVSLNSLIPEALAKLPKARRKGHSGQAKCDQESRIFKQFWIPAFAGMTAQLTFARTSPLIFHLKLLPSRLTPFVAQFYLH
jgi:hypothetical protein